jgi:hypothetical protein
MEIFAETVSSWRGMYFEMDGSFVWVHESIPEKERSQIDGMIYDRNESIEYVDLKGSATRECWLAVLNAILGEPASNPNLELLESKMRIHAVALGEYTTVHQFLKSCDQ